MSAFNLHGKRLRIKHRYNMMTNNIQPLILKKPSSTKHPTLYGRVLNGSQNLLFWIFFKPHRFPSPIFNRTDSKHRLKMPAFNCLHQTLKNLTQTLDPLFKLTRRGLYFVFGTKILQNF